MDQNAVSCYPYRQMTDRRGIYRLRFHGLFLYYQVSSLEKEVTRMLLVPCEYQHTRDPSIALKFQPQLVTYI